MKTGPSIYSRIFVPFTVAIVTAMTAAWWLATTQLSSALNQRLSEQLSHATNVLAHGSFPLTSELLGQLAILQDAEFALLGENGEIGISTLTDDQVEMRAVLTGQSAPGHRRANGYDLVVLSLPPSRSARYASIAGITSLREVEDASQRAAVWLGGMALLGVLLMAWWGHRLSRAVTVPIRKLADMARQVAAGDREIRVALPASREVGALTNALNEMNGALAGYEAQLLEKNRLASLGEMATRVTHEIRNPLTAIKLQLQLLDEGLAGDPLHATTAALLDEIRRLELIVASTLSFARTTELERTATRLDQVVESVVELIEPQLEHRGITLEASLEPLPEASLDGDRLKQVVFNLITNAADAMPDGGRVRIATSMHDDVLLLTVEDSGPGLADPQAVSADTSPGGKGMGLGIGLVISRELIELHGGHISADPSPALGGARFTITLPAANES